MNINTIAREAGGHPQVNLGQHRMSYFMFNVSVDYDLQGQPDNLFRHTFLYGYLGRNPLIRHENAEHVYFFCIRETNILVSVCIV